ncbi:helix-turn-helix domain-containing protein [Enterococcus ratti]|nr:hypothetical protein [Enterococcus ratti]
MPNKKMLDYTNLMELHKKYKNWSFVAISAGLKIDEIKKIRHEYIIENLKNGLSVKEVAKKIGISKNTIFNEKDLYITRQLFNATPKKVIADELKIPLTEIENKDYHYIKRTIKKSVDSSCTIKNLAQHIGCGCTPQDIMDLYIYRALKEKKVLVSYLMYLK